MNTSTRKSLTSGQFTPLPLEGACLAVVPHASLVDSGEFVQQYLGPGQRYYDMFFFTNVILIKLMISNYFAEMKMKSNKYVRLHFDAFCNKNLVVLSLVIFYI